MQTAEFIAEATGLETSHLRTISRRLREADLLSQGGHGRGAAAATPQDAALLLLVIIPGVPPLHAVRVAEAILACTVGTMENVDGETHSVVGSAVEHIASLIVTGGDADLIHVTLQKDRLAVQILGTTHTPQPQSSFRASGEILMRPSTSDIYFYEMPARSPARRKLAAKFGRPTRLERTYRGDIPEGVLPEISEFLGIEAEGEEVA